MSNPTVTSPFTRLYLVPIQGKQQIIDVPSDVTILSEGKFVTPGVAPTVTLTRTASRSQFTAFTQDEVQSNLITQQTQEVKVCFREPSDLQQYPDGSVIEATDPSNGACLCGITCAGTNLAYVQVLNVPPTV